MIYNLILAAAIVWHIYAAHQTFHALRIQALALMDEVNS